MHFYIFLSLLLLGGYGESYAHQDTAKGQLSHGQSDIHATSLFEKAAFGNYSALHFETQHDKIETFNGEEEEEELSVHKLHFAKKFIALNKDFLNSYYANAPGLSYDSLIKTVPSGKPFHSLSSRQYILFRVIRI